MRNVKEVYIYVSTIGELRGMLKSYDKEAMIFCNEKPIKLVYVLTENGAYFDIREKEE